LQLKTSIDSVRWLAFQACTFRYYDESSDFKNEGNYIELIKFLGTYNDKVASVALTNAPQNGKYTSPQIQKEILYVFVTKSARCDSQRNWRCQSLHYC
jgi:hypothetical protein